MVFGKLAALLGRRSSSTGVETRPQEEARRPRSTSQQRFATGKSHPILTGQVLDVTLDTGKSLAIMDIPMLGLTVVDRDSYGRRFNIERANEYFEVGGNGEAVVICNRSDGGRELTVYSVFDLRNGNLSLGIDVGENIFVRNENRLFEIGRDEVSGGYYLRSFNPMPLNSSNINDYVPSLTPINRGTTKTPDLYIERSPIDNLSIGLNMAPQEYATTVYSLGVTQA